MNVRPYVTEPERPRQGERVANGTGLADGCADDHATKRPERGGQRMNPLGLDAIVVGK